MANHIVTMHWNNIDPKIISCQKEVFRFFGHEIKQVSAHGVEHGKFIDETMESLNENDSILLLDIDCFPLNPNVIDRAFQHARDGGLFGCAQTANHIDAEKIYVGPMFMCLSKQTWKAIGSPSAQLNLRQDVGQSFSDNAAQANKKIELLFPTIYILPKWRLGNSHLFGIGTFYEGDVFHLFESHVSPYQFILEEVARSICSGAEVDYFGLMKRAKFVSHFEGIFKTARRFGF